MKEYIIIVIVAIPVSIYLNWWMEGNYGKTTYGNIWNWLRGKRID